MHNRCPNLLFYTLTGRNGWSYFNRDVIDIGKIVNMTLSQRAFMIFDRTSPYTLKIEYDEPTEETVVNPTVVHGRGFGFTLGSETQLVQIITKRYSLEEIHVEMESINQRRQVLDEHMRGIADKLQQSVGAHV